MFDNGMSFLYWWLIILIPVLMIAGTNRRSMKPRARLDADEFLRILDKAGGKVIRVSASNRWRQLPSFLAFLSPIAMLFPSMYVMEGADYYYYTYSKEPLSLPESAEVIDALAFWFC